MTHTQTAVSFERIQIFQNRNYHRKEEENTRKTCSIPFFVKFWSIPPPIKQQVSARFGSNNIKLNQPSADSQSSAMGDICVRGKRVGSGTSMMSGLPCSIPWVRPFTSQPCTPPTSRQQTPYYVGKTILTFVCFTSLYQAVKVLNVVFQSFF